MKPLHENSPLHSKILRKIYKSLLIFNNLLKKSLDTLGLMMKRNEPILWRRPNLAWTQAYLEHKQMVDRAIEKRIQIETDDILRGKGYIEAAVILFEEKILGANPRVRVYYPIIN